MRILLTCTQPSVMAQVERALAGRASVEITTVATPRRALDLLDEGESFALVLADNDLAPEGGFSLAREVKARGQAGAEMPPVVLLIARAQDVWLSNWSQADAYVLKPVDPFDLAQVVDALASGGRAPALPGVGGEPTPSLLDRPDMKARVPARAAGSVEGSAGAPGERARGGEDASAVGEAS